MIATGALYRPMRPIQSVVTARRSCNIIADEVVFQLTVGVVVEDDDDVASALSVLDAVCDDNDDDDECNPRITSLPSLEQKTIDVDLKIDSNCKKGSEDWERELVVV